MSNVNKLFFFHRGSRYIHFNSLSGDQYGVSMSGGLENHSKPGEKIQTVLKSNLQLDKLIYLQIWPNLIAFTYKCWMQNCFIKFISDGNSFGSFCTLQPLPDHPGEISDDYVLVQFVLLFRLSLLSLVWGVYESEDLMIRWESWKKSNLNLNVSFAATQTTENHTNVALVRGAIFFIGMSLWGAQRVKTLANYSATTILPTFVNALGCKHHLVRSWMYSCGSTFHVLVRTSFCVC